MDKISNSKLNHHYLGANSLVATDATCFMGWIVAQYGLKLPKHYKMKDRCFKGVGDKKISTKNLARNYLSKQKT